MNSEETDQIILAPLSNMMNSHARGGRGPFGASQIWTSIISDVLLCGGVVIPATSFLCNPAIVDWLERKGHRDILEWLWASGRLGVLFYTENRDFEGHAQVLIRKGSPAVELLRRRKIELLAKYLDKIFAHPNGKLFTDVAQANTEKTDVSSVFIRDMSAFPSLQVFQRHIIKQAKRTREKGGVLDGTWWCSLARTCPELSNCITELAEVGVIVFDFAHSSILDKLLSGHTYRRTISSFQQMASPLLLVSSVTIQSKILDQAATLVDPAIFVKDIIDSLSVSHLQVIAEDTAVKTAYHEFAHSTGVFQKMPQNEGALLDVKAKFDTYINALGSFIRTGPMVKYCDRLKDLERCESRLRRTRIGQFILSTIRLDKIPMLGTIAMTLLKSHADELEDERAEMNRVVETSRPLPFKVVTRISKPEERH